MTSCPHHFCLCFSSAGVTNVDHHTWLFKWGSEFKLRILYLQNKHFIYKVGSLGPTQVLGFFGFLGVCLFVFEIGLTV